MDLWAFTPTKGLTSALTLMLSQCMHDHDMSCKLDHLLCLGGAPTATREQKGKPLFHHPPKDGSVLWIRNLQQLNKVIKQKQYPAPLI